MDFKGQGARFSNVPGRVQAGLKTSVKNDSFWSETVGSRLGEPGGTPYPNQELPGEPPSAVFLVTSGGSAIHVFLALY